jgi:hypothetical protein
VKRPLVVLALALTSCALGGHPQLDTGDPSDASPPANPDRADGEAVTWDTWVSGLSNVYCVSCHNPSASCGGSGCHSPDDPALYDLLFDMRQQSSWVELAPTIRCGIAVTQDPAWHCSVPPEKYPKGDLKPTDAAREIIVEWIDAGCP